MIKLKDILPENIITEATRSQIGYIDKNGKITSTYVHYDGYPKGVGRVAKKYYSGGKVKDLLKIDKGIGISVLEPKMDGGEGHSFNTPEKGQTIFYGRDRGERRGSFAKGDIDNIPKYLDQVSSNGAEYVYLYNEKDKKWYYVDVDYDTELKLL